MEERTADTVSTLLAPHRSIKLPAASWAKANTMKYTLAIAARFKGSIFVLVAIRASCAAFDNRCTTMSAPFFRTVTVERLFLLFAEVVVAAVET